ncbi:MAG: LssY C-terminal domain-containing protein [Myxococcota bacterium]|nr:LssY C-terminal domain-containing protein [Myxococcota bacterium]
MRSPLPGVVAFAACLTALACASFEPSPPEEVPVLERAQTQTQNGVTVTTAVPSRDEARKLFGIDLEEKQIQPVYLEVKNGSNVPWAILLTGVDPNYFSAREAAYKSHFTWRPGTNAKIDDHFDDFDLDTLVAPGETTAGFVFSNLKLGTKEVRVRLHGPQRTMLFQFYVAVPGFKADYHEVDWEALEAQDFKDFQSEQELREALRALPCCTTRADGTGKGDPVNLIVIGTGDEVADALTRAGWDETEKLTAASGWRTFKAFFGGTYKYSPMSSLYLYGRGQDAGFQKARDTIHERNHLRFWMSDMKFRGEHVWVGTITRDIGVYFTTRAWNLTTHAIDPAVDEARTYISEDFMNAQSVSRLGFVTGVGAATKDEPHRNLMNAPWWTDGNRLVMEVAKDPTPYEQVGFFYWDWGTDDDEEFNRYLQRGAGR